MENSEDYPVYACPATPSIVHREAEKYRRLRAEKPAMFTGEIDRLQAYARGRFLPSSRSVYATWEREDFDALLQEIFGS